MDNEKLSPSDVFAMPLKEFERRFGFRPEDAKEKHWFGVTGRRLLPFYRVALDTYVLDTPPDLSHVNMEDGE